MDYVTLYTDFLKQHSNVQRPLSIVCDSSNGATGKILQVLLPQLGLKDFTLINDTPDPEFSAHGPNPLLPGALDELSGLVVAKKADLGVAFDADGDRAFFIDEKGAILPSFVVAALLFMHSQPPYVADELVYQAHNHMHLFGKKDELHPSRVGVFFIKKILRETQANVGAEFSGHYYFNDFFGSDSGIFAMVRVLSILSSIPQTLSQFTHNLPPHSIKNDDLKIEGKDWKNVEKKIIDTYVKRGMMIERREGITLEMQNGWVNIRPSNTEPVLRLYAGAQTGADATKILDEIKALI